MVIQWWCHQQNGEFMGFRWEIAKKIAKLSFCEICEWRRWEPSWWRYSCYNITPILTPITIGFMMYMMYNVIHIWFSWALYSNWKNVWGPHLVHCEKGQGLKCCPTTILVYGYIYIYIHCIYKYILFVNVHDIHLVWKHGRLSFHLDSL